MPKGSNLENNQESLNQTHLSSIRPLDDDASSPHMGRSNHNNDNKTLQGHSYKDETSEVNIAL
jgi:predicted double-glycine peptidase